jgi:hypothetical protein
MVRTLAFRTLDLGFTQSRQHSAISQGKSGLWPSDTQAAAFTYSQLIRFEKRANVSSFWQKQPEPHAPGRTMDVL